MTTTAAQPATSIKLQVWATLGDPRVRTAIALGGLVAAVGGGLLLATSDHLVDPVAFGTQLCLMVIGTVAAALVWIKRRPGNRIGPLLLRRLVGVTRHGTAALVERLGRMAQCLAERGDLVGGAVALLLEQRGRAVAHRAGELSPDLLHIAERAAAALLVLAIACGHRRGRATGDRRASASAAAWSARAPRRAP